MTDQAERATPLFVLGTARSGTTWLANLLISHSAIVGLAAREHQGIHESHVFDHTRFALPGTMTPQAFVARYAAEDYFTLAGVSPGEFCAAAPAAGDAVDFFAALMDLVARRAGARYWLEKTPKHAIYADLILQRFPSARFVVIKRRFHDTMLSQMARFANPRAGWVRQRLEKAFRYESDLRAIVRLERAAPDRTVVIAYEALAEDPARETARILRCLGLPEQRLASAFAADSSFGGGRARPKRMPFAERVVFAAGRAVCALLPLRVLLRLRERRDRGEARVFPKYQLLGRR